MKKCRRCKIEKDLNNFYKHKQMSDGYLNICKNCKKSDSMRREKLLRKDPLWVEKEKKRAKEKYKRLNYRKKQLEWDKNKPWKNYASYKNLNRNLSLPKGYECHHWNYNRKNIANVFILSIKNHRKAHTYLTFDFDSKCFIYNNTLLDTKQKHKEFLDKFNLI